MNHLRHNLLPRTAFTAQKNGRIRFCDLLANPNGFLHFRAVSNEGPTFFRIMHHLQLLLQTLLRLVRIQLAFQQDRHIFQKFLHLPPVFQKVFSFPLTEGNDGNDADHSPLLENRIGNIRKLSTGCALFAALAIQIRHAVHNTAALAGNQNMMKKIRVSHSFANLVRINACSSHTNQFIIHNRNIYIQNGRNRLHIRLNKGLYLHQSRHIASPFQKKP